jgi:hypothetical protein
MVRDHIRSQEEPESLHLGKMLKKSNVKLSLRHEQQPAKSEARLRFAQRPADKTKGFEELGEELRKSNVALAVAGSKSGREWTSVLKDSMSQNADKKFACEIPHGFEELGVELRKSNVLLHAGRHDYRSTSLPVHRSETKNQFVEKPISHTASYAETLGKELRTSSIDVACGGSRSSADWRSAQHATFADNTTDKWAAKKPEGFYHLIKELRKTNVTLGTDRTVYDNKAGAVRFTRNQLQSSVSLRPAGHVPGC